MELLSSPVVVPIVGEPIAQGALVVEGAQLVAVGPKSQLERDFPDAKRHHFDRCCLMPGLVNAHTHLELTAFPTDDFSATTSDGAMPRCTASFVDWVIGVIQYRKSVVPQTFADAVNEGIQRSLRAGTTCVGEISTLEGEFALFEKTGIRAVLFPELISFDANKAQDLFEASEAMIAQYRRQPLETGKDQLLYAGLSPHAPYTVSRPLLKIIQQFAREEGVPVQIHAAESFQEMEFFFDAGGEMAEKLFPFVGWNQIKPPCVRKTPVTYLHSIDFLKCQPTLIHCVQVSDADIDAIAASHSKIVLCPRSNEFLNVGTAPIGRLKNKGITLALGTDSLASNSSLSMWDEMRFLRQKPMKSDDRLAAKDLLRLSTLGGAQVLGLDDRIGSLEAGKLADVLAVRLKDEDVTASRLYDYLIDHTYDADIQMVMVGGQVRSGALP